MGLFNYLELGFMTVLTIRITPMGPFKGIESRVKSPVISSY